MLDFRLQALISVVLAAFLTTVTTVGVAQPTEPSSSDTLQLFEEVWLTFDEQYSYFEHRAVDWEQVGERYRNEFTSPLSPNQFAEQLALMLSELEDRHVNVVRPDGTYVDVYNPSWDRNFTDNPRNRYSLVGLTTLGEGVIWHGWLLDSVAYIRIDSLTTEAFGAIYEDDIENLFSLYSSASGMILDVRANSGGNENFGLSIASRFTEESRVYGYVQYREGAGHGDFGELITKTLHPSTGSHFLGPVVTLIGGRNMSSAEWFALMLDVCPNVTLLGAPTAGSSGNPAWYTLENGVQYSVSRWIAYRPDMVVLEGTGITPDVLIEPGASFDSSREYVIEAALEILAGE